MPPIRKFDKESIISASLDLIEKEGRANFNARKLASYLGSSVQPIFHNFVNMEELEQEVYKAVYNLYANLMISAAHEEKDSYKKVGRTYIKFAMEHKEFFRMIFMSKTNLSTANFMGSGIEVDDIVSAGQQLTGLSYEEQKEFHMKVWIFTHGIACLVNTETVILSDKDIDNLLTNTVKEMFIGFKKERMNEESN